MAAWFRLKYPHLADMALASSAPMVAVADFKEYLEVVGTAMSSLSGMRCYEVVQKATQQIRKAFQGLAGVEVVAKTFNLCPPIEPDSPLDFANFFSTIANAFSGTVQYHEPGDVESVCRFLNAEASNSSEMATLAKFLRTKWGNRCVNLKFQPIVNFLRNDSWMHQASVGGLRQWIYQTCTEYGYFQTDKSIKQPFGNGANTLKYYEALCDQTYGHGFVGSSNQVLHNGINRTNIVYGGLKPKLTKVIFTHGTIDPWHAIGVLQDLNEDTPTIIVTGTSHCQDLESISEKDLPQMKAAKLRVQQLISKWLSE
ncbi:thymus-specific serine protease-like [Ctenocephalides felis]|uniref:thymus-specific serine protease-like n=1 Tax=Ctenocephalides felis TaxID=7515 RepID=UPI000E6E47DF|nr:thymus-specific serine protease-like [Ctenocephalides felis]